MKGLLRSFAGGGSAHSNDAGLSSLDTARRLELLDDYERTGLSWIWASDSDGALIYVSPHASDNLQHPTEELVGSQLSDLFETDPDSSGGSDRSLNFKVKARNKIVDLPVRFITDSGIAAGQERWWSLSGLPKFDDEGRFHGYRGSAKDITVQYQRQREDSKLAEYDSLTGLANRHRMNRRIDSLLAAYKTAKRSCGLLMLDLDRFKQVNDTMGHQAGDDLLKEVAVRLRAVIGDAGEIGRLGGDEFQVILPDMDDRGALGELAEKVIKIVSQPYPIDGKRAIIGTSVGIAIAPYDGVEKDDLIHSSDLALYAAKNGGRGQYRFYSSDLKDEAEERETLEKDLRKALKEGELDLHYQPVVRIEDSMVVGLEALMRWEHEERGMVSPGQFIPVAEESNLIVQLGEWALRKACHDATKWPKSVRVAVNVSAVQFANAEFPTVVANALAQSGLEPDRLELELTETVFMGDNEVLDETFKTLKGLGVRLALDDFGTGYSSLGYLRSAPFDKLKVDRSFVESCTEKGNKNAKIITAIIGLANALQMEVTIEGVEAFDQLELVRAKGGKLIQGYIYSKPLPLAQVEQRITSGEFSIKPDGPDRHRPERRSVFRRIGVIHEDHCYQAVMRDLSKTGARIEGLLGVPKDTTLVLDLGAGQLAVCQVTRSQDAVIGVEFETPLTSDGSGGLVTRHRVSPYALAAAGMPLAQLPPGQYQMPANDGPKTQPKFMQVQVTR